MSGPETSAGQRLLSILGGTADADYLSPIANAISAIEAEARAAAVAPLEKAALDVVRTVADEMHEVWFNLSGVPEPPAMYDWFTRLRALLSAPSPVREPEGLDERGHLRAYGRLPEAWQYPATPERPADEVDG